MSTLRRGTRAGIWFLTNNGQIIRNSSTRSLSTDNKKIIKFENGINGEKILKSPYGMQLNYPNIPIHEFVWHNIGNWQDKIALKCGVTDRKYTYAEARDAANWVARSLINMGFKNGDVIALVLPNLPETAIAFLGATEAGLIITTVNPQYTVDEISKQLSTSSAKGIITNGEISSTVLKSARNNLSPKHPFIVIDDGTHFSLPAGSFIPFKDLITRGKTLPPVPERPWTPDDIAVLPYSSGTTGLSKGVMLSHKNLISNMMQVDTSLDGDVWRPANGDYQEIVPVVLPLFHIYGMNALMLPIMRIGAQLITLPKFTPKSYIDILTENKVTVLFVVPPLVLFLIADQTISKNHLANVHFMVSGAAPIAASDVERFYEKYGLNIEKLQFAQGYGLTESSPVAFLKKGGTKKYASIGYPVYDTEARLVDPETKEDVATPGKKGELWIRGAHVMKGYYNNEEATKETLLPDGWLKTGDLAYFDEECDFYIADRLKELIKVKGFQVPPAELEALLRTHPDIEEAGVVGITDDKTGESPRAFVLMKKGRTLSEKDVQDFVKGKVAEYKELKGGVIFVNSIPKNASGKILRRVLKEGYESK